MARKTHSFLGGGPNLKTTYYPNIARGTELDNLQTCEGCLFGRCRLLTLTLPRDVTCHIRPTHCVVEGQNEVLLVDEIDFSFIVKRLGRGTEKWERIREGVDSLNGWMKGLGHPGYVG